MIVCKKCGSDDLINNGGGRIMCKECGSTKMIDTEAQTKSAELAKKVQKFADTSRIERKTFREHARISNALEKYSKELVKLLKEHPPKQLEGFSEIKREGATVFVQLSDLHFNELVSLPNNRYDFTIASSRLKEYAKKIKNYASAFECSDIVVLMTGDFLNSDRRLDELLNQATNRAKASYLGYLLLRYFLEDLSEVAPINCYFVTGNESRAKDELGFSQVTASDNYDVTIFQMLKIAFESNKTVNFHEGDPNEQVIYSGGQYFLLMHGTTMGNSDTQKKIAQIIGKYALKGIIIRYVFYGHVHSAYLSDWSARSSSLTGSNTYNENALQLTGRASQNIYIHHAGDILDSIKIDLQGEFKEGYDIDKELEAYNAKSADKIKPHETIMRVII